MSATFHLYKPRLDLTFLGCGWMQYSNQEWKHMCDYWETHKEGTPLYDTLFEGRWDDGQKHDWIDLTEQKRILLRYNGGKRMLKHLMKYGYKVFHNKHYAFKYLAVDQIEYRQGWFLKQRFFDRDLTLCYCTSKLGLIRFFHRYVNLKDEWGKEAYHAFVDKWEDGMLFACLF